MRGTPAFLAINQNFVDVTGVNVTYRPLDQAGFFVDQRGCDRLHGQIANVVPQAQQIFTVALDFRLWTLGPGGAHDQAHPFGNVQFGHHFLEPATIRGRRDLAGNAAAARRIRHEYTEAARQREVRGERRALGAALLLHHLDQQDLPAVDHLLNFVVTQKARLGAAFSTLFSPVLVATDRFRRRSVRLLGVHVVPGIGLVIRARMLGLFHAVGEWRGGVERIRRGFDIGGAFFGLNFPLALFRVAFHRIGGWADRGWADRGWADRGWADRGWADRGWSGRDF